MQSVPAPRPPWPPNPMHSTQPHAGTDFNSQLGHSNPRQQDALDDDARRDQRSLILVADDDPDILTLVGLRLDHAGYRTVLANNGSEALALACSHRPDLVVLDVDMPYLSGFEVTERLQERDETRSIPVLLLTARRTEEDVLTGLTAGAHDYMMKPFSPQELETRVRSLLDRG